EQDRGRMNRLASPHTSETLHHSGPVLMNTDLNLLFGVLALQSGLINSDQFVEACALWTTRKATALADLLLERGWLVVADVARIQYLVDRNLEKHGDDPRPCLAAIDNNLKRQLLSVNDDEIRQSLGYQPVSEGSASTAVTLDVRPAKERRYSL